MLAAAVGLGHLAVLGWSPARKTAAPLAQADLPPVAAVTLAAASVAVAAQVEPAQAPAPAHAPEAEPQARRVAPAAKPPAPLLKAAPAPEPIPTGPADVVVDASPAIHYAGDEGPTSADEPPARLVQVAAPLSPQASATVAAALAAPPPVYKTRVPPAAKVVYKLTRSGISGSGTLDWKPEGGNYTLKLEGKLPLVGTLITQTSRGGFDKAGLAPVRFTDKRLSKPEQAANFQRPRGQISFSGPQWELPILAGTQDRLSVMVQLAAVAGGYTKPPANGEEVKVYVVGARGDGDVWTIRFQGRESVRTADGAIVDALKFLREPDSAHGTRAEFWLDPAKGFLPVRARLTDGSGDALELLRDAGAS